MSRNVILVNLFCAVVALASLGVAAWMLFSGRAQDLDALFLILVCLLFALCFSIPPLQALRSGGFGQLLRRNKTAPGPAAQIAEGATQKSQTAN
jgi:hypothetical protein